MEKKQDMTLDRAIQIIAENVTEKTLKKGKAGLTREELFDNAVEGLRKMAEKDPATIEQFIVGAQRIEARANTVRKSKLLSTVEGLDKLKVDARRRAVAALSKNTKAWRDSKNSNMGSSLG